jgi:hypothetical protein
VDDHFATLVLRNVASDVNRLLLGLMNGCGPFVSFAFHRPPIGVWHNMLICHNFLFV